MYCKECNSLLNENDSICPNCGIDNKEITEETTEIYLDKISNPKEYKNNKNSKTLIFILILILGLGIISLYIFKDSKKENQNDCSTTTTTTTTAKLSEFKFNNLILEYNKEKYGTSSNTIFLKENNNINININEITEENYMEIINSNDAIDDLLGTIETKTFANLELNSYSHIFSYDEKYYLIEVNYDSLDNEVIQLELSRIIKSLKVKKK